ncbi:MAG: hypothetical protein ACFFCW_08855 [Candidatus Hodarchaeota archaeon]
MLYTGNDFLEAIMLETVAGRIRPIHRPPSYQEKIQAADRELNHSAPQALNQIFFFKTFPQFMKEVIAAVSDQFKIIK